MQVTPSWFADGLLFENCSCQLICPAHISFKQDCTHDRCLGHWAVHIASGRFGEVDLSGLNVLILYDAPQRMYEGGWRQVFLFGERSSTAQREALTLIFSGRAGGPWEVLAKFVEQQLDSQVLPLQFEDQGRRKRFWIDGVFDTEVSAIRANNDQGDAMLVNLFNQIHSDRQVLARGTTVSTVSAFPFSNDKTHALYSDFSWSGSIADEKE